METRNEESPAHISCAHTRETLTHQFSPSPLPISRRRQPPRSSGAHLVAAACPPLVARGAPPVTGRQIRMSTISFEGRASRSALLPPKLDSGIGVSPPAELDSCARPQSSLLSSARQRAHLEVRAEGLTPLGRSTSSRRYCRISLRRSASRRRHWLSVRDPSSLPLSPSSRSKSD